MLIKKRLQKKNQEIRANQDALTSSQTFGNNDLGNSIAKNCDPVDMKKAIGEMPESPLTGFSEWDLNTLGLITSDVWGHFSISKTGAIGNPEKGTAEKGKKILNLAVKKFAQLLKVVNDKKLVKHYSNPTDRS